MKSASSAKTVRFSEIVQRCGAPESHLVLVDPPKDKALQLAIKAARVMTLFQATTGTRVDYGNVGFEKGASRQYLIFPKSLRAFTGRKVIGIKYDLLSAEEIPKSWPAAPTKTPQPRKPNAKKPAAPKPARKSTKKSEPKPETAKIIPFRPEGDNEEEQSQELRQARKLAKQAMDALETGKQVAAFQLLKRILTL